MNYAGNSVNELSQIAWFKDNSDNRLHEVGTNKPNSWDFYDMLGNVNEWCFDSPSDSPVQATINWIGTGDGSVRSVRGGSWSSSSSGVELRSAGRSWMTPITHSPVTGFRVCVRKTDGATKL